VHYAGVLIEENHYYPYGLLMEGVTPESSVNGLINKYKYSNEELQLELGLNQYHFGARFYDPVTGRFNVVDPLAEVTLGYSTYHYALNNPVSYKDPTGLCYECEDDHDPSWLENAVHEVKQFINHLFDPTAPNLRPPNKKEDSDISIQDDNPDSHLSSFFGEDAKNDSRMTGGKFDAGNFAIGQQSEYEQDPVSSFDMDEVLEGFVVTPIVTFEGDEAFLGSSSISDGDLMRYSRIVSILAVNPNATLTITGNVQFNASRNFIKAEQLGLARANALKQLLVETLRARNPDQIRVQSATETGERTIQIQLHGIR
jgi:RHS repeat-associated protein